MRAIHNSRLGTTTPTRWQHDTLLFNVTKTKDPQSLMFTRKGSSGQAVTAMTKKRSSAQASQGSLEPDLPPPPLCRDFVRNVCSRGTRCKYRHQRLPSEMGGSTQSIPEVETEATPVVMQDSIVFCHDFQNLHCTRTNCVFLHCHWKEEEEYRRTGYLPPNLRDQAIKKGVASDLPALYGAAPICKDHLKGECFRPNCKFRHVTAKQYDIEMNQCIGNRFEDDTQNIYNPYAKRPRRNSNFVQNYDDFREQDYEMVQEENRILKQRVEELKKQVSDLTTTNEFLLDQNAQLRLGVKPTTTVLVTGSEAGLAPPQAPPPSAQAPPPPAVVSLSVQPLPQSSMSIAVPTLQPCVSVSGQPVPVSGPPMTISMAVPQHTQPSMSMAAAGAPMTITGDPICSTVMAHAVTIQAHQQQQQRQPPPRQMQAGGPASSLASALQVQQETQIVTFPIASIRQTM